MTSKKQVEALWQKEYVGISAEDLSWLNDFERDEMQEYSEELLGKLAARAFLVKIDKSKLDGETLPESFSIYISTRESEDDSLSCVTMMCLDEGYTYPICSSIDYPSEGKDDRVVMNTAQEVLILNGVESLVVLPEQFQEEQEKLSKSL